MASGDGANRRTPADQPPAAPSARSRAASPRTAAASSPTSSSDAAISSSSGAHRHPPGRAPAAARAARRAATRPAAPPRPRGRPRHRARRRGRQPSRPAPSGPCWPARTPASRPTPDRLGCPTTTGARRGSRRPGRATSATRPWPDRRGRGGSGRRRAAVARRRRASTKVAPIGSTAVPDRLEGRGRERVGVDVGAGETGRRDEPRDLDWRACGREDGQHDVRAVDQLGRGRRRRQRLAVARSAVRSAAAGESQRDLVPGVDQLAADP